MCVFDLHHAGQPLVRQRSASYVCHPNSKSGVVDGGSACLQLHWAAVPTRASNHLFHMLRLLGGTTCAVPSLGLHMVGLLAFHSKGSGVYPHEPTACISLCISRHNNCTALYRGGVSWPIWGC